MEYASNIFANTKKKKTKKTDGSKAVAAAYVKHKAEYVKHKAEYVKQKAEVDTLHAEHQEHLANLKLRAKDAADFRRENRKYQKAMREGQNAQRPSYKVRRINGNLYVNGKLKGN